MRVLITGGTGFVGRHLQRQLQSKHEVLISSRGQTGNNIINLDLLNSQETLNILGQYSFDIIYHLASQSSVHHSFKNPFTTISDNITSTLNLLKSADSLRIPPKIILASSGEIYKSKNTSIHEEDPLEPRSPYSISKLIPERLATHSKLLKHTQVTSLRLFNHTGPGQSDNFVLGSFSKQIALIKKGQMAPILKVGNLKASRDFIDVRDVCNAYELVSQENQSGQVYNVCSGKPYVIQDLLNKLIEISGVNVQIETGPKNMRPSDIPLFRGDNKKFSDKFSWQPKINIDTTLSDMLDWWETNL